MNTPFDVHVYRTWSGALRYKIVRTRPGMPRTEWLLLDEVDATTLLRELQQAVTHGAPSCIDCGSNLHSVDDPGCPEQREPDEKGD